MQENELFAYMMANEKLVSMISTIEQTMEFMVEYKIKPDDEVKNVLKPIINTIQEWIK